MALVYISVEWYVWQENFTRAVNILSGDQFMLGHQKMTFKKSELGALIRHCVGPHLCALIASSTIIIAFVLDTRERHLFRTELYRPL